MKKITLAILLCGFGMSLFGQGILFREGSWKEMLALAKKENKLVFVDNYTSWCGPCKKMLKEVFSRKDIGEYMNTRFVNYKQDMEQEEGKELAGKYIRLSLFWMQQAKSDTKWWEA